MGWDAKKYSKKHVAARAARLPERGSPLSRGRPGGAVGDLYSAVHAGMLQILLNIEMSILVS